MHLGGRVSILGIAAVLALTAGCHKKAVPPPPPPAPDAAQIIKLPKNGSFAASPSSVESQMAAFLASNDPAPRTFRLDNDQFSPWSDNPGPRTQATLSTIILILRSYPNAKVMLTGYTDNEGSPERNQALSQSRAETFERLLHNGGVGAERLDARGLGAADPVADNTTKAGQAANRRIELTITSK